MRSRVRALLPDIALFCGVVLALAGAALYDPRLMLIILGIGLVGLAVWMSPPAAP